MIKKTTLAVIGLAASSFASAGTMGPVCTPGNVTVPCEAKAWELGIEALYLQAIYGEGLRDRQLTPAVNQINLKNDWDWGFRAEGAYHFNTGNDVSIDWTHYSNTTSTAGLNGNTLALTQNGAIQVARGYEAVNKNKFDQVNVVMGQHTDLGLVKKMRFYGGMQYANVQTFMNKHYAALPAIFAPITNTEQFIDTDFKGFGPVVGIDYSYNVTPEISVTANGSGSILYGTTRYNGGFVGQPVHLVFVSDYAAIKALVPSVEAKLGLNYAYAMAQGVLNLEGGYQVLNYFSIFRSQSPATASVVSDYGLYGPYFGFKYLGNA